MEEALNRRLPLAGTVLLVGVVTLAPVWLSPVLATNDGSSHLYNAALADAVRAGQPPYATYFQLRRGVRPNVMTEGLLSALGPRLGWDRAERVVVTLAMIATFLVALALIGRGATSPVPLLLTPLAGWLATNWFVWGGAYDFALSIPLFCGLLLVLDAPITTARVLVLQAVLGLLYLTHVFTFAVGIGLVIGVVAWQAFTGSAPWRRLVIAVPALALLVIEMASGGPGSGAAFWSDLWGGLRDLVMGDFVVSVSALDLVAGVSIIAAVAIVAVARWREARRRGRGAFTGPEVVGLGLIVVSLVAPTGIGPGTWIPIRLRCLGVLALLPAIAQVTGRRPAFLGVGAAALLAALGAHSGALIRQGRRWNEQLQLIDRLLSAAGAQQGAWVETRFTGYRVSFFDVVGYRHVVDRIALRRHMVVLDNYEALYSVFSTTWRAVPDWTAFRQAPSALTVRLVPGTFRWPDGVVYVLHEHDRALRVADPRLAVVRSAAGGPFAVTCVRRRE